MDVLLVAATPAESSWMLERLQQVGQKQGVDYHFARGLKIRLLHTGIGMVNTAYTLGRYFQGHQPDLAIQFGIAGTFDFELALGSWVEVVEEHYGDLGAESPDGFLSLAEMGFEHFQHDGSKYHNSMKNKHASTAGVPKVSGLTVNRVHGTAASIEAARTDWGASIESMEGAAFFQCCILNGIPFHEFRGISNLVEPRNRASWEIEAAALAVQQGIWQLLRPEWVKE